LQGEEQPVVDALKRGDLDAADIPPAGKKLLEFAALLTLRPSSCTASDIQTLRDAGWQEPQIAEAVYIVSMFAFFNRVADAFGLLHPWQEEPSD